jgi:hypothetical protein
MDISVSGSSGRGRISPCRRDIATMANKAATDGWSMPRRSSLKRIYATVLSFTEPCWKYSVTVRHV